MQRHQRIDPEFGLSTCGRTATRPQPEDDQRRTRQSTQRSNNHGFTDGPSTRPTPPPPRTNYQNNKTKFDFVYARARTKAYMWLLFGPDPRGQPEPKPGQSPSLHPRKTQVKLGFVPEFGPGWPRPQPEPEPSGMNKKMLKHICIPVVRPGKQKLKKQLNQGQQNQTYKNQNN